MNRKAKIVATLGPSCRVEPVLRRMIEAGLDVARLNFSHGTHEDHGRMVQMLRQLSAEMNKPVTILQDLQGPKLRVGELPPAGIPLKAGQRIILTDMQQAGKPESEGALVIPMDVPDLVNSLSPGSRILMDDGHMELQVTAVKPDAVEAEVVLGGVLQSHKGVNMPGANIRVPGFTEKDREDLAFGLELGVDEVAISFVHPPEDVALLRRAIA